MQERSRQSSIKRVTRETAIELTLNLDGGGKSAIHSGVPFLDHMLELFAKHGFFDLSIQASGDTEVEFCRFNQTV